MKKMADSSSSDHDQHESIGKRKAATKKRHLTHQAILQVKPCSIYSNAAEGINFNAPLTNANLADSDEDFDLQPVKKGKRIVRKKTTFKKKESHVISIDSGDESFTERRTPERTTHCAVISLDSPCSPPPSPSPATRRQAMYDLDTSKVLRSINVVLTNVRSIQSEASSQSDDGFTPLPRTPGGSLAVIDVDEPSPAHVRHSITVRVRCRQGIQRFLLKMTDTFSQVIDDIAKHEGVTSVCVKLINGGQDISELDTPESIHLHAADIIDCLIVDPGTFDTDTAEEVEVTIQGKEKKSTMTKMILRTDNLLHLMEEYSVFCERPLRRLTFTFDGDVIQPTDTPTSLDFELDTNMIDVRYK